MFFLLFKDLYRIENNRTFELMKKMAYDNK